MKILLIQPTGDKLGHYSVYFSKLPQALATLGHDVTVFTNHLTPSLHLTENPKFEVIMYKDGKYKFEHIDKEKNVKPGRYWLNYFINSLIITYQGLRYSVKKSFDVVYISDSEFAMAALALKVRGLRKLPPILMQINASNFAFSEYPGGLIKKSYKTVQKEIFRSVFGRQLSAVSILGKWHEERLRKQLRISQDFPIEIIPDGGGDTDQQFVDKTEARQYLDLPADKTIFLFLGILRRDKGLETLSEALKQVSCADADFHMVVAGHPFDYSESQIKSMFLSAPSLAAKVSLSLDYVAEKDLKYYYGAADALILPYSNEYKGSTGPLMKGVCTFGLPAIVSDLADMGNLTKANNLGFTFEPENVEGLADAIQCFINASSEKRNSICSNAMKFGNENSWEDMAQRYESAFEKLLIK